MSDEGITECYALQSGVELGQRLGVSADTTRRMMRRQFVENSLRIDRARSTASRRSAATAAAWISIRASRGSQAAMGATPEHAKSCRPKAPQDLNSSRSAARHTTSVKMRIPRNTLWALCTAIPIQALRYRFVGYAVVNISRSVPGIAHGTCRW